MEGSRIAVALGGVLADSYMLMLKSHNYHWNVTGPYFQELHALFQSQYEELFLAVDEIAEQIRTLAAIAPGSLREYGAMTRQSEPDSDLDAVGMVDDLARSHESLRAHCNAAIRIAASSDDQATIDMLTQRLRAHGKAIWMLRATIAVRPPVAVPVSPEPRHEVAATPERKPKKKSKSPKLAKDPKPKASKVAPPVAKPAAVRVAASGRRKSSVKAEG